MTAGTDSLAADRVPSAARTVLLHVAAALATRDASHLRAALEAARDGVETTAVDEVILQSHLFVGFPDALNALGLWREVSGTEAPPSAGEDPATWTARGQRVCATVYGANYDKLRINVGRLHPDVDGWMVAGGYGRTIGRPGLDLATRELCIAALLAVWNVPRQLHSHLRGALNTGASVAEVDEAVEVACGYLPPDRAAEVRALWGEIRAKAGG
ncbi:carboxymuconolactone decarboxylase family protein [Longimicrobium sp.]|uniref:carboxymuconolactone decarboxylase family protein n=1 Tax=Longimicrobium sp. TaxID=2029185 RepID=UPI002E353B1F|nr:carboxymuconolactone decarboxylase family protein [Longimicrobium sp.]HEX6041878.1 carboxymuconolactone decarboxylase family protein [Longimicrobium sp.]